MRRIKALGIKPQIGEMVGVFDVENPGRIIHVGKVTARRSFVYGTRSHRMVTVEGFGETVGWRVKRLADLQGALAPPGVSGAYRMEVGGCLHTEIVPAGATRLQDHSYIVMQPRKNKPGYLTTITRRPRGCLGREPGVPANKARRAPVAARKRTRGPAWDCGQYRTLRLRDQRT